MPPKPNAGQLIFSQNNNNQCLNNFCKFGYDRIINRKVIKEIIWKKY